MLQSYLGWANLKHYLDDFIYIMTADLETPERLQQENTAYQLFTDCLDISRQDAKDVEDIVVSVFGLEVDINKLIICVPLDKVARAQQATRLALKQFSFKLKEAQSLTGFLSLYAQAVCLE